MAYLYLECIAWLLRGSQTIPFHVLTIKGKPNIALFSVALPYLALPFHRLSTVGMHCVSGFP